MKDASRVPPRYQLSHLVPLLCGGLEGRYAMTYEELLSRVSVDPRVCGCKPCIRDTRIYIATTLAGLAEGLAPDQIIDHCPQLTHEDIRAALAYAGG